MTIKLSSAFLICLATAVTVPPTDAQTRTSKSTASSPSSAPMNIVQLCKFKEAQLVQMNALIGSVLTEMNQAKDVGKQAELSTRYQSLKGVMNEMESSWERLGCINLQFSSNREQLGR